MGRDVIKRLVTALTVVLLVAVASVPAQQESKVSDLLKIELLSPWDLSGPKPVYVNARAHMACLNLITLKSGCGPFPLVHFGNRMGVNINLFQVSGASEDRTRMLPIGKYDWTDNFTVPVVEPWEPLFPGERRTIVVNTSGGDGAPGAAGSRGQPGRSGDGTSQPESTVKATSEPTSARAPGKDYGSANVTEQVSSSIAGSDGKVRKAPYTPIVEAKKGYIYAVHVMQGVHDFYVLIRVDEIVDGEQVKLSYRKIDLPPVL